MDTQKNNVESEEYPAHHNVASLILAPFEPGLPNMALNLAPFGRWTLRDKPRSAG
jgi:hypothetical protein